MRTQEQIDRARRVLESRVQIRLRLADGAAWSDTVTRCAVLPCLLADLCRRAGRSLGEVQGNVALFRKWKAGQYTPVDLDRRLININLAAHVEQAELIARRDGLEEPVACEVRD